MGSVVPGSKQTKREHLEQVSKTLGKKVPELIPPEVDGRILYLMDLYLTLREGGSLSFSEINSYQQVTGVKLHIWEIETLMKIDSIYARRMLDE